MREASVPLDHIKSVFVRFCILFRISQFQNEANLKNERKDTTSSCKIILPAEALRELNKKSLPKRKAFSRLSKQIKILTFLRYT